jgi:hypothetical protein
VTSQQKHEETIREKLNFSFLQSVHISHNRGCEPEPSINTCKSNTFVGLITCIIRGENKMYENRAEKNTIKVPMVYEAPGKDMAT